MATKNKTIGYLPFSIAHRPSIPADKNSEKKYYAVAQARETLDIDLLSQHMAEHGSPFTEGTIIGVLRDLVNCGTELLRQGYAIKLDGLATLRVTYNSLGVDEVDDAVAANIVKKVNLIADFAAKAVNAVNANVEFEYMMTREAQAQAKKNAKENLANGFSDTGQSSSTTGGSTGGNSGGDSGDPGDVTG